MTVLSGRTRNHVTSGGPRLGSTALAGLVQRLPGSRAPLLLLPVSIGFASYGLHTDFQLWRFEWMRALDRAGLYLFFVSPVVAAIACWETTWWRKTFEGLAEGLPDSSAVWRLPWLRTLLVAWGCHALVLTAHAFVATGSGATGPVQVWPILVQFLSIVGFAATGALVGSRARTYLAFAGLLAVLVLLNTLLAQYGFRRFSQVGEGTSDFVEMRYTSTYLVLKTGLYVSLAVAAAPLRPRSRGIRRLRLMGVTIAVVSFASVLYATQAPLFAVRHETVHCEGSAPSLCLPHSMEHYRSAISPVARRVASIVAGQGITSTPSSMLLVGRAETRLPATTMVLYASPATVHDPHSLTREVVRSYTEAEACDDLDSVSAPPDSVLIGRAVFDGWLQERVGAVESGSYPTELVRAVNVLSPKDKAVLLQRLSSQVWSCSSSVDVPQVGA